MMSFYSQILVHVQLYPRPVPSTEFLPFSTGKLPSLPEKEAPEELEWKLLWHSWILVEPWDQWLYSQGSYHRRNISWNGFHQDKGSTNVPHTRSPTGMERLCRFRPFIVKGKYFRTVPKKLCVASIFKPSGNNVNVKQRGSNSSPKSCRMCWKWMWRRSFFNTSEVFTSNPRWGVIQS